MRSILPIRRRAPSSTSTPTRVANSCLSRGEAAGASSNPTNPAYIPVVVVPWGTEGPLLCRARAKLRAMAARTMRATHTTAERRPVSRTATGTAAVRSRVHARDGARVMVKRTAPVAHLAHKPQLSLVPRRRRTARLIALVCAPVFALMLGAAAFQTQLASRQLRLDAADREIRDAYNLYDVMRRERAELRSPGRSGAGIPERPADRP